MNAVVHTDDLALLLGDALDNLRKLPCDFAQMCVTSPPYYGLRDYGIDGQIGLEETPEQYVRKLVAVFEEMRRVLKPDGVLWLNLGDSYARNPSKGGSGTPNGRNDPRMGYNGNKAIPNDCKPKDLIGIPWLVAFALRSAGWWLRQDLIWHKPNPMPAPVTDRCVTAHEYLFLFAKAERYYFDHESIREPFADERNGRDGSRRASQRNRGGREDGYTKPNGVDPSANGGKNKRSVWTVPPQPFKGGHFAAYPPALVEPCVLAGSRTGDVVIDPFSGAGTTGIVARRLGRKFVGIELNPEYAEITRARWIDEGVLAVDAR